jgi:2-polyprenyl-3-methyl-5-hydroxy-6-metoxy-1,4-benzoquinol methylase
MPGPDIARVTDESADLYGREYWFSHQERHLGQPTILARARADLPERCLYWLRTLLKYRRPPARVLELGSAHGGFVAMLRWAGFDATGLEISPWVVNYAQENFAVPMLLGRVEDQDLAPASLDVIALMDVLEHLHDPAQTMGRCLSLLKPEGILLMQTPCYVEGASYEEMVARSPRFVEMFQPAEHLYLFSRASIAEFFNRLGARGVAFEPALFAEYDMFPVVSRAPLISAADGGRSLGPAPSARMMQALLDLGCQLDDLTQRHTRSEKDRARRLQVIEEQGGRLGEIEAERNDLRVEVSARREQSERLEADRAARLQLLEEQGARLGELEAEGNNLRAEIAARREQREVLEADRAARLRVIEEQGRRLGELEAERKRLEAALSMAAAESRDLLAEVRAQQEQIDVVVAQLRTVQQLVHDVQGTRVYRWLRRLGRWRFVEGVSVDSPAGRRPEGEGPRETADSQR